MSAFWKRKVRKYFSIFDLDSDGVISRSDFVGMADRFCNFEGAEKRKAELLKSQFEKLWESYVKTSGPGNETRLTAEMLIDSIWKQRDEPQLKKIASAPIYGLFHLMDVNCDGYLQEDEYRRMLDQLGVPDTSFAKKAFKAIDANGDGKLSIDEFVNSFLDFMYEDNENSPNTCFFGPLVD